MDKSQDIYAACFSLFNLMDAAKICYKNVTWKRQPQGFTNRTLTQCKQLHDELLSGTYRPVEPRRFTIMERGKQRDILPVDFRDRVAQRCLCDNYLYERVEDYISEDSSACIVGRGLAYAHDRVRQHAEACPVTGWAFQYDFHDYFASIDRRLLTALVAKLTDDERMRWLIAVMTGWQGGLELGSHVSQLLAGAYPTPIDRAIEALPGVVGYHRYMDDGVALCEDRDAAIAAREEFDRMAKRLRLVPNPRKTHINRIEHPFIFCKMRYEKQPDGSVRMVVRKQQSRRSAKHAKNVRALAERCPERGIDLEPVRAAMEGYLNRGDEDLTWLVDETFS